MSKPTRLNLDFDVVVTGDTMTGHSRASRLPRTTDTGRRLDPSPAPALTVVTPCGDSRA